MSAPLSLTPEQVAADPVLREVAAAMSSLYINMATLDEWLAGSDYQKFSRRSLIADLVDAHHVLDPDPHDDEVWLIDRPWLAGGEAERYPHLNDLAPDYDQAPWLAPGADTTDVPVGSTRVE